MRLSASNLAWGSPDISGFVHAVHDHGLQAVELAPTAIWADSPDVAPAALEEFRSRLVDAGLEVSGLQSLLYGRPDLQLFDRTTWPAMREHLVRVIDLAGALGASCAVFGSPRNRQRGTLAEDRADEMAVEFLHLLEPALCANNVVLTVEPNAPSYGADYVTHYQESVRVADLADSSWVAPQIDTGCLAMVDDDPASAVWLRTPGHVHVSAPDLVPPPVGVDHEAVAEALRDVGYGGWVVLEMLPAEQNPRTRAGQTMDWLRQMYGDQQ